MSQQKHKAFQGITVTEACFSKNLKAYRITALKLLMLESIEERYVGTVQFGGALKKKTYFLELHNTVYPQVYTVAERVTFWYKRAVFHHFSYTQ